MQMPVLMSRLRPSPVPYEPVDPPAGQELLGAGLEVEPLGAPLGALPLDELPPELP